ncbi:MAG TPA: hypothetical protein PKD27_03500 [Tepidiformaceae bacterium]|nr:hypothetical protein [Tepidiformaceae bacterium]
MHLYGYSGRAEAQERLYRLLYRAIARAHAGMPLTDEPGTLLSAGVSAPFHLDGVPLPVLE